MKFSLSLNVSFHRQTIKLAVGAIMESLHKKMSLEICYLSVFEKTTTLMVSKQSLTEFTVNKRNQLVRLILD